MPQTSTYILIDEEMECLSIILNVMESEQWDVLCDVILDDYQSFQDLARSIAQSNELNGMTLYVNSV